jgi:hypothetical protein
MKKPQNLIYRTPGPQHKGPKCPYKDAGGNNRDKEGPPKEFAVPVPESLGDKGGKQKGKKGLGDHGNDRVKNSVSQGRSDINILNKPEKVGKPGPFGGLHHVVPGKGKVKIHHKGDDGKKTDQDKAGQYIHCRVGYLSFFIDQAGPPLKKIAGLFDSPVSGHYPGVPLL